MRIYREDMFRDTDADQFSYSRKEIRKMRFWSILQGAAGMFGLLWLIGWFFDL